VKPLLILALAIAAPVAKAKPTTCSSHTTMMGTTTTDCRTPERKPVHCTSYYEHQWRHSDLVPVKHAIMALLVKTDA
jgi:hypothetical protein